MQAPVTLITGSSKGLGRALAEHYVRQGHVVIGCSRRPPETALENYRHFEMDVSDEAAARTLFTTIRKEHGRLDHLINNAGIASMNHSLLTPMETVDRVMRTNVAGTFLFCREAARLMQRQRKGRIVNFATVAVPLKLEGEAVYAASKAAVVSLTQILARELGDFGITVNAVGPNPIKTDLIRGVPTQKLDQLIARQAIKRYGEAGDVIRVVDFFLQPQNDLVTGQVLYLGGA